MQGNENAGAASPASGSGSRGTLVFGAGVKQAPDTFPVTAIEVARVMQALPLASSASLLFESSTIPQLALMLAPPFKLIALGAVGFRA